MIEPGPSHSRSRASTWLLLVATLLVCGDDLCAEEPPPAGPYRVTVREIVSIPGDYGVTQVFDLDSTKGISPNVLAELWQKHASAYAGQPEQYVLFHNVSLEITFRAGAKVSVLKSVHPFYGRKSGFAVGDRDGLQKVSDEKEWDEIRARQSAHYRKFVADFDAIFAGVKELAQQHGLAKDFFENAPESLR